MCLAHLSKSLTYELAILSRHSGYYAALTKQLENLGFTKKTVRLGVRQLLSECSK